MVDEQRCPAATYTEAWLPEQLRGAETLSSKVERHDGTPLKTDGSSDAATQSSCCVTRARTARRSRNCGGTLL